MRLNTALFTKYGERFCIVTDLCPLGREISAFLSPISQTSAEGLQKLTPAGVVGKGRFLFMAPADAFTDSEKVVEIRGGGCKYTVQRCDRFGRGGMPGGGHVEAVVRLEGRVN